MWAWIRESKANSLEPRKERPGCDPWQIRIYMGYRVSFWTWSASNEMAFEWNTLGIDNPTRIVAMAIGLRGVF